MDLGLRDKVALVTGGSRGIGRANALGPASSVILSAAKNLV
jgi:NAD(P)-dependent dehydrogenase (short-subunit alcohol dehydrogenase family)